MNGLLIVGLVKSFKSHAYGLPVMSLNSRSSDRPTVKKLGSVKVRTGKETYYLVQASF